MDAELSKIPEKYRTAFILCHLEGKTCEEAAQQLGCPRGTVLSRLGRARERLRARLVLRGWTSSSTSLVHLLDQHAPALGVMMPVLMNATVHSAVLLAAGKTLTGSVSGSVVDLLGEALREMRWSWLRYGSLLALLVFLGVAPIVWRCLAASPPPTPSVVSPCHDTSAQSNR
jgi:hypothetical protein